MRRVLGALGWSTWGFLARWAGKAYIAGPELQDAMRTCHRLAERNFSSTVCFWNVEADAPRDVAVACVEALGALGTGAPDSYLSLKLPALGFQSELLDQVVDGARSTSRLLHFDSLSPDTADPTY